MIREVTDPTTIKTGASASEKRREFLRTMTLVPIFTVLMIISARIAVAGAPIPITLQLPMVILTGLLLGPWKGAAAQGLYLVMGLIGLPVFSAGGGLSYIFQPTFGFLLGFPVCAFCAGIFSGLLDGAKRSVFITYTGITLSSVASILVCYIFGGGYFFLFSHLFGAGVMEKLSLSEVLVISVLPFIWKDLLMMLPVALIAGRLRKLRALARDINYGN